jgi:hypothetical protein
MDRVAALRPETFAGASAKAHVAAMVMDSLELSPCSREEGFAIATLQEIAALETEAV